MSIIDHIGLDNTIVNKFSSDDNIVVCVFSSIKQLRGLYEFSKYHIKYKMLLFYYLSPILNFVGDEDNCSREHANIMLRRVAEYTNIIPCKYTIPCGNVIQYFISMSDILEFKNAYICDLALSRYTWSNVISNFNTAMKHRSNLNVYNIPLAGNLLEENLTYSEIGRINCWHRISHNSALIKPDNNLPIELLNKFVFETSKNPRYNNKDTFLCTIMEYIEENKIPFNYTIAVYTHRTPFYYWLEHVKPSEEKQSEFLELVNSDATDIRQFLEEYNYTRRKELYTKIRRSITDIDSMFEDTNVIKSIKRFHQYLSRSDNTVYCKRW